MDACVETGFIECKGNLKVKDGMQGETIVLVPYYHFFHWVLESSGGAYQDGRGKETRVIAACPR